MEISKTIDLQKLVGALGLNVTSEELVELIVEQYTMSQPEIVDHFHFSNQPISNMREQNLLREIKKGLYLREEVENMRAQQISGKRLQERSFLLLCNILLIKGITRKKCIGRNKIYL